MFPESPHHYLACILFICLMLASLFPAVAAPPAEQMPPPAAAPTANQDTLVTPDQLDRARQALQSDSTLSDTEKKEGEALYDQASQWLQQYRQVNAELAELRRRIADASQHIKTIRAGLGNIQAKPEPVPEDVSLDQLQVRISEEKAALEQAREELKKTQDDLSRLQVGGNGFGGRITKHTKLLAQIEADLHASSERPPSALIQAHRLALEVRRQLRQAELDKLKLELGNLDILVKLDQAQQDQWKARVEFHQQRLDALQKTAQRLQEAQAEEAVRKAELLRAGATTLPEPLQAIAAANATYRKERQGLIDSEKTVGQQLQQVQTTSEGIKDSYDHTRQRVETIGLTKAVGRMLEHRRAELPPLNRYRHSADRRTAQMDQATERQIEIEDSQHQLATPQESIKRLLNTLPSDLSPAARIYVKQRALELATARQQALQALQSEYGRYVAQLARLQLAEQQLVGQIQYFSDFIDRQLIWSPSGGFDPLLHAGTWSTVFAWAGDASRWAALIDDLRLGVRHRKGPLALLLGVFVLLLASRRHARDRLVDIARATRKIRSDNFLLTLHALWIMVAIAAPLPLLMIGLGWGLLNLPEVHPFSVALAEAIINVGIMWGVVGLLQAGCEDNGLADRHLHWPAPVRAGLSKVLRWVLPAILPLGFMIGAAYSGNTPDGVQALGQLAFVALMLVISTAVVQLLRRGSPLIDYLQAHYPNGWLMQLRFLWFPLLVGLPLGLAVTTVFGYYYTALQFAIHLRMTIWLFFGLLLVRDLLLRWFYITERRLRLDDAIKRREQQQARAAAGETPSSDPAGLPAFEETELDYSEISEQSRRVVRIAFLFGALLGAWSIWSELIPALGFLNRINLPFSASRVVDGIPKEVPITLADLGAGLLFILITFLGARNLPGLLEITLLRRFPLSAGARYAITSLSQYAIVAIGLFWAFRSIGLQWSSIQWLVAALGVGVGFGLQEIVANFISGIILLFEQPIRVGDVVTVNETIGTVSRIRIRATTITNWDRQELVVPNKAFITGSLLNWTLSNNINRRIITVGVAYGSDVVRAMKLLVEAARETPNVLDDPSPFASFEEFGDSALILRLRAYFGNMDIRLSTTSALYQAINDKFNQAGIVIAFPQQDVHLDVGEDFPAWSHDDIGPDAATPE